MKRSHKALFGAMMLSLPLLAIPAHASDFSGLWPYFLAAIVGVLLVFIGLVFGLTHFLPWTQAKRVVRASAFGLFFAPVQYLSDGSPDTYDGYMTLLGPALIFDEPFNGPARIAISIIVTTFVFWAIAAAVTAMRRKTKP